MRQYAALQSALKGAIVLETYGTHPGNSLMPYMPISRPTAHWSVRVDATLAARVEMALWDPILKKPRYRSRKMLVEHLLEEWLQQIANEGEN